MRKFSIFVIFIVATVSSENASLLTINATVGVGGTLAPVSAASHGAVTTPAPTVPHLNLTVPPSLTVTTPTVPHLNATVPGTTPLTTVTPKASTKFPETCQSLEVLEQSAQCYYALEGLDSEMGSSSLTDTVTIELLNGYCDTFSTCYPAIEKCAEFDSSSIAIIKGFCDFYQFATSRFFLTCAQTMEGLDTPCTDNATETILNFNGSTAIRCAKLTAVSSCSVEEVGTWCNLRAVQNYQMFVNRNIQAWMC